MIYRKTKLHREAERTFNVWRHAFTLAMLQAKPRTFMRDFHILRTSLKLKLAMR